MIIDYDALNLSLRQQLKYVNGLLEQGQIISAACRIKQLAVRLEKLSLGYPLKICGGAFLKGCEEEEEANVPA